MPLGLGGCDGASHHREGIWRKVRRRRLGDHHASGAEDARGLAVELLRVELGQAVVRWVDQVDQNGVVGLVRLEGK